MSLSVLLLEAAASVPEAGTVTPSSDKIATLSMSILIAVAYGVASWLRDRNKDIKSKDEVAKSEVDAESKRSEILSNLYKIQAMLGGIDNALGNFHRAGGEHMDRVHVEDKNLAERSHTRINEVLEQISDMVRLLGMLDAKMHPLQEILRNSIANGQAMQAVMTELAVIKALISQKKD